MKILMSVLFILVFAGCQQNTDDQPKTVQKQTESIDYLSLGQQHAQQAQSILGSNLKQAMEEKGPLGALSFCHEEAIPLTHSVVVGDLLDMQRVSDKNRNPDNVPNAAELSYINQAKQQLSSGQVPEGMVSEVDNQMVAYYPIVTQPGCLKCHGSPEKDIAPETMNALSELYPNDKAIGFDVNELRGIWVVTMAKQSN